jgi:daunorubicin resistance ABC transporter ATP-binding subunit
MALAIEAGDLRKSFGELKAVRGVDLAVRSGELFALLGPNGAGKTTTIRMLTTLLKPDGGSARVCGYDIVKEAGSVRARISVTGQYAALDEALTARQNLALFAGLYGYSRKDARKIADELLALFGLSDAGGRTVGACSGGMRRRLDLAAGLLPRPEVMFLDEPTTGLDPQSRRDLWDAVRGLKRQGTTVLLTTQYLEEADQLADRIGFIAGGRLIAVGTPAELKARYGGKTLTIRLADGADADGVIRLFKETFGLECQREEDGRIVKTSVRNAKMAHAAVGALLGGGTEVEDFALGEPSLEDVYFALNGAAGAREAAV